MFIENDVSCNSSLLHNASVVHRHTEFVEAVVPKVN